MRVAVLGSGGKDSTYAAWWSQLRGWDVVCIVTVGVTGEDSLMFQLENTPVAGIQASSMGIPWLPVASKGIEEEEITDLERAIRGESSPEEDFMTIWPKHFELPREMSLHSGKLEIDGLVSGALRSDYQKTRLELMCERIGVRSFSPIWHKESGQHMESLLNHGFGVVFTSVSAEGMDERWIGLKLEKESLKRLKNLSEIHRFNLDGEGGEFETIVVSGPHMSGTILFDGKPVWNGYRGFLKLNSCSLGGYS